MFMKENQDRKKKKSHIQFTKVILNDIELDADFFGVYFIIILKENKEISAFTLEKLLKSYQKYLKNIPNGILLTLPRN